MKRPSLPAFLATLAVGLASAGSAAGEIRPLPPPMPGGELTRGMTVPSAPTAGTVTAPAGTSFHRLSIWNQDLEWGGPTTGPAYWTRSPGGSVGGNRVTLLTGRAPFPAYGGAKTLNHIAWLWDATATTATSLRSGPVDATPGRFYAGSGVTLTGRGVGATLYLEFYDASRRRLKVIPQQSLPVRPGASIAKVTVAGTAPPGTASARLLAFSSTAAVGSSYWDAFVIDESIAAATYDPRLGTGSVMFTANHRVSSTLNMTQVIETGTKHTVSGTTNVAAPVYDGTRGRVPAHSAQLFGTVRKDDGIYKMWYVAKTALDPWSTWYAESADGITWGPGRPVLRDVTPGGVVRNPDTSNPSRRYLMLAVRGTMQMVPTQDPMPPVDVDYRTYSSPDGITWQALSNGPVMNFRDIATVTWDPVTRRFIALTKQASGINRQLFVSTSTDFVSWTTPRRALRTDASDPPASDVYSSSLFRMGEELVALPVLYTQKTVGSSNGPLQPYLASSLDGVHFERPAVRAPMLPLGPAGSLDDGMILTASEPVIEGDRMRVYYGGWTGGHEDAPRSARIFMAEWGRERLSAMRVSSGVGYLTTRPLRPTGSRLSVNALVPSGGRLQVAVLDAATGRTVAGYESSRSTVVTGDVYAAPVTWQGKSLAALAGKEIRLRLEGSPGVKAYGFRLS